MHTRIRLSVLNDSNGFMNRLSKRLQLYFRIQHQITFSAVLCATYSMFTHIKKHFIYESRLTTVTNPTHSQPYKDIVKKLTLLLTIFCCHI